MVVVLPSPAGVGVIAETRTRRAPSARRRPRSRALGVSLVHVAAEHDELVRLEAELGGDFGEGAGGGGNRDGGGHGVSL